MGTLLNDEGFQQMCGRNDVWLRAHRKEVFKMMVSGASRFI